MTQKIARYTTDCSKCDRELSLPFSLTVDQQGANGHWVRCSCGWINYARKDTGNTPPRQA